MLQVVTGGKRAEYIVLQLSLPGREVSNIGILLYDPAANRLYSKLRQSWEDIADEADIEVLEHLDRDFSDKIEEMGGEAFLADLEDKASNALLVTARARIAVSDFRRSLEALFEQHVQRIVPFVTHLPLYSLRAAASRFGEGMEVEPEGWVVAPARLPLTEDLFVARVVGKSMEPVIPDGSLCIFRAGVVGSRQSKRLLIQKLGVSPEFSVKKYMSVKVETGEGEWHHQIIRLIPLNPSFEAMEFHPEDEARQFSIIAEFVQVL